MRCPRVYTDQPLATGAIVALEEGPARHLAQVLRLRVGNTVTLFNGDGRDYQGTIATLGKHVVEVTVASTSDCEPDSPLAIHLGLAISKSERMDFAIQKSVEMGVVEITPLITDRCVVRISETRMKKRLQHWHNIIISACEQSGRSRLPSLHQTVRLDEWLTHQKDRSGFLLDHRSTLTFPELPIPNREISLLVGPEGGFSDNERGNSVKGGFSSVKLGSYILRTETAPLAAIASMQTLWGDFR